MCYTDINSLERCNKWCDAMTDIKKLIGEATEYDKKEALTTKDPRSWCKSVSAFANGIGGALIFGIADDNSIVGLAEAESDAERISGDIHDHLDPIPDFVLSFHEVDGKKLIILRVERGDETPYYYIGKGGRTAYMRVGNASVPCSIGKLRELALRGAGSTYDSLKSKYKFANMSFTKLRSVYKQRTGRDFQESDYESFGLVDEEGVLTNAGALLADESPVRHSRLFCTRWNGLDKVSTRLESLDDREYSGSLISLLQEGVEFVKRNSRKKWKKTSDGRLEMPDYPERSVLEGLVNALIHRSYLDLGSEVHIDMYDDRLEIYSPGGMPDGSKIQELDIRNVPSRRRNPILADVFGRLNYMERRGSGFKKILDDYAGQPQYEEGMAPVFRSEYENFFLTLRNLNYHHKKQGDRSCDRNCDRNCDKKKARMEEVYALIEAEPKITMGEIAEQMGLSKRQVEYIITGLKQAGRIERQGSNKGGIWVVM